MKVMDFCQFCEAYTAYKNIHEFKSNHEEWYGEPLMHEMTVALVTRSWRKGNKAHAGRTTDYRYRGIGYKLNFCPECGKRLEAHNGE